MSNSAAQSVRRGFLKSCLFSGAALALVTSGVSAQAQQNVKIGALLPLTGQIATFGQEARNGLNLALENAPAGSTKLNVVIEDSQGTTTGSAAAVNKLIKSDKVTLILGELTSSNTITAAGIAQENKVPLMSPAATNDTITVDKPYVSRLCFVDSFQGQVMAKFALDNLKAKTAMILVDSDSDYSRGLRDSFQKAFTAGGGKIVADISYSQKDTDFTSQLSRVRKEKPDVVFVPGYYTQVGAILRQSSELNIKSKMLGGDGWDSPDLFKIAGKAAAGHYISNHFSPDDNDPKVQQFVKTYKDKYKMAPGAMAALTYDAATLVQKLANELKGATPDKYKDAIASVKDFQGVTGKISLDGNRNATKPAVILETTADGFKFVSRINP